MASYDYIVLANSNNSLVKRFHVVVDSLNHSLTKNETLKHTISGQLELSIGSIDEIVSPVIRVHQAVTDANYGTLDDLKTFFSYINPNGTPSNVISYTDHLGNSHSVYMVGSFKESLLTVQIEGEQAVYLCTITLHYIPS